MTKQGILYVDVRTHEEVEEYSVKGSVNITLQEIIDAAEEGKIPKILENVPLDTPICTFCISGGRAKKAAQALGYMGFSAVKDIGGTTEAEAAVSVVE